MVLNGRPLTNQKDGLSNSSHLTNQDFYVHPVDEKKKQRKQQRPCRTFLLPPALILTFLPFYSLLRRLGKTGIILSCQKLLRHNFS